MSFIHFALGWLVLSDIEKDFKEIRKNKLINKSSTEHLKLPLYQNYGMSDSNELFYPVKDKIVDEDDLILFVPTIIMMGLLCVVLTFVLMFMFEIDPEEFQNFYMRPELTFWLSSCALAFYQFIMALGGGIYDHYKQNKGSLVSFGKRMKWGLISLGIGFGASLILVNLMNFYQGVFPSDQPCPVAAGTIHQPGFTLEDGEMHHWK